MARNLSRWVDVVAARVFSHRTLQELAAHATIPVINGLSDLEHPCQAMADFFTLWERGLDLGKLRLVWVGDGNNVCNSVLLLGAMLGTTSVVACPPGYEPDAGVLEACRALGGRVQVTTEARDAIEDADVVYTDTWISMGQEGDRERRLELVHGGAIGNPLHHHATRIESIPSRLVVLERCDHRDSRALDGRRRVSDDDVISAVSELDVVPSVGDDDAAVGRFEYVRGVWMKPPEHFRHRGHELDCFGFQPEQDAHLE